MQLNLPNLLTFLRILLLPVVVGIFYLPFSWSRPACAIVFAIAGLTDWLDGYLARRLGQHSAFGAFLDPVADKLMVAVVLVLMVADNPSVWMALPAAVIIGREIVVSALREWMAELGKRARVSVSLLGKIKTVAQFLALFFLLYRLPLLGLPSYQIGMVLLYIAAALTIVSMLAYLNAGLKVAKQI